MRDLLLNFGTRRIPVQHVKTETSNFVYTLILLTTTFAYLLRLQFAIYLRKPDLLRCCQRTGCCKPDMPTITELLNDADEWFNINGAIYNLRPKTQQDSSLLNLTNVSFNTNVLQELLLSQ